MGLFRRRVHPDSEAHPAAYPMGTGDHSHPSSVEVETAWSTVNYRDFTSHEQSGLQWLPHEAHVPVRIMCEW
jgi:hypothetical protein